MGSPDKKIGPLTKRYRRFHLLTGKGGRSKPKYAVGRFRRNEKGIKKTSTYQRYSFL